MDPVVLGGTAYERAAIQSWLTERGNVCPETGRPLSDTTLISDHTLRALLAALRVAE